MNVEIDCFLQNKKKMMKEWFFLEEGGESRRKTGFRFLCYECSLLGGWCFAWAVLGWIIL